MALKATIYKADLQIADMDRHYYADHQLTIAQHPSETIERLMVRVLAFARCVDGQNDEVQLSFTKDLFETDEPALWKKDLTGQLLQWVEVGLPDETKVKKASSRCDEVVVFTYGSSVDDWWSKSSKLKNLANVKVFQLTQKTTQDIQTLCARTMQLQLNIMDGEWTLSSDHGSVHVEWIVLQ
jgi:uncharacterized protein YaeQ